MDAVMAGREQVKFTVTVIGTAIPTVIRNPLTSLFYLVRPLAGAVVAIFVYNTGIVCSVKAEEGKSIIVAPSIEWTQNCTPVNPTMRSRISHFGSVKLDFYVDETGKLLDRRVVKSSGFPNLDVEALETIARCKFMSGTINGVKSPAWITVNYEFK